MDASGIHIVSQPEIGSSTRLTYIPSLIPAMRGGQRGASALRWVVPRWEHQSCRTTLLVSTRQTSYHLCHAEQRTSVIQTPITQYGLRTGICRKTDLQTTSAMTTLNPVRFPATSASLPPTCYQYWVVAKAAHAARACLGPGPFGTAKRAAALPSAQRTNVRLGRPGVPRDRRLRDLVSEHYAECRDLSGCENAETRVVRQGPPTFRRAGDL